MTLFYVQQTDNNGEDQSMLAVADTPAEAVSLVNAHLGLDAVQDFDNSPVVYWIPAQPSLSTARVIPWSKLVSEEMQP